MQLEQGRFYCMRAGGPAIGPMIFIEAGGYWKTPDSLNVQGLYWHPDGTYDKRGDDPRDLVEEVASPFVADPIKVPEHYNTLRAILNDAFSQASSGKGSERHASGQPFEQQPILTITREEGLGFPIGQAKKKAGEAHRMADRGEHAAAERDLLGAINYLAAAVIFIREKQA